MQVGRSRSLTVAQQFVNLQGNPVSAGNGRLHAGRLVWTYDASPSALSRIYRIRIEMEHDLSPEVFVETPDLNLLADGRDLPHVYRQDPVRLCLYLPGTTEWRPWMRLDQTVVPWTALWLFYFEDWLSTGEWKGGGEHPPATPETRCTGRHFGSRTATLPVDSGRSGP
jgi:hypothetical protein